MALLVALTLISLALVVTMITRQSVVLAHGTASGERPDIIVLVRKEAREWWLVLCEWAVVLSKRGSHVAALLLAKGTHWVSLRIGKLVARLHRHGRDTS